MKSFLTRRSVAAGLIGAATPSLAFAQMAEALPATTAPAPLVLPPGVADHPAFKAWTRPQSEQIFPLDSEVKTKEGPLTLRDWLGGKPAALILFATWCPPCVAEKSAQAYANRILVEFESRLRIHILQVEDDAPLSSAASLLKKLDAADLPLARAGSDLQKALRVIADPKRKGHKRPVLPYDFLISADGREYGHMIGAHISTDRKTDYWAEQSTLNLLFKF